MSTRRFSHALCALLATVLAAHVASAQDSTYVPPPTGPGTPGLLGPAGTWHLLPASPTGLAVAVHGPSSIYDPLGQRVIEFAGFNSSTGFTGGLYAFQPCGPGWLALAALGTAPSPRFGHSAIYDPVRKRMIVFGGNDGAARNDLYALTLTGTPTWSPLVASGTAPSPRYGHDAIYDPVRDRMLVFGGFGGSFLGDVWSLDLSLATPAWTLLTPSGPAPAARDYAGAIYDPVRDRMVVFGGNNGSQFNDLWQLTLGPTPAWTALSQLGTVPAARLAHSAIYDPVADMMVIVGGVAAPSTFFNDVRRLTLSGTPTWLAPASPSGSGITPAHSRGASYVPGIGMLVIHGGTNASSISETDEIELAPFSNFQPQPAAVARDGQIMVVDPVRRRILMHGGEVPFGLLGDLLQMPLDGPGVWQTVCTAGIPPAPRQGHSGLYDPVRDRMLVFGGYAGPANGGGNPVNYRNDLWQLSLGSPITWSTVTTAGTPPAPRDYASLIYDSSRDRLVLFGGNLAGVFRNDVWELSLGGGTPTWTQLTPAGTPPSPRLAQRGIYDPLRDRMVVFGGFDGAENNELWALQFSPTLQWIQLAPSSSPSGRHSASLVYDNTRDRLLLFGGYDGTMSRNDLWELPLGGPLAWASLVAPPVQPAQRHGHDAIYDPVNDLMVVHGGFRSQSDDDLPDSWVLDFGGSPTPTLVSLVSSDAAPGHVRLTWQGVSTVPVANVLRRESGSPWTTLGSVSARDDRWSWEDDAVRPGTRYSYALDFGSGPQAQVEVDVPSGVQLALAGMRPNPIDATSRLVFSLPASSRARVEVFDVAGRRAAAEDLGTLEAGVHRLPFPALARLGPGVYTLKLIAPTGVRTTRAILVR